MAGKGFLNEFIKRRESFIRAGAAARSKASHRVVPLLMILFNPKKKFLF